MRRATVLHTLADRCMAYALFFFFLGDLPETSVQIVKLVTYFLALIGRIRFAEFRIWIRV